MSDTIQIKMRADRIPNGATVTKITGTKHYQVVKDIKIYDQDVCRSRRSRHDGPRVIHPNTVGGIFLRSYDTSQTGNLNEFEGDKCLLWHADPQEVACLLERLLENEGKYGNRNWSRC